MRRVSKKIKLKLFNRIITMEFQKASDLLLIATTNDSPCDTKLSAMSRHAKLTVPVTTSDLLLTATTNDSPCDDLLLWRPLTSYSPLQPMTVPVTTSDLLLTATTNDSPCDAKLSAMSTALSWCRERMRIAEEYWCKYVEYLNFRQFINQVSMNYSPMVRLSLVKMGFSMRDRTFFSEERPNCSWATEDLLLLHWMLWNIKRTRHTRRTLHPP